MKRLFLALVLVVVCAPLASAQTLRIYHIDVEQTDAALVVMPNGKSLLIDSHFGGIDDLVDMGVPILEAYDRGKKEFVDEADREKGTFKDYMTAVGEDAHALRPGDTIDLDPLVTVTCDGSQRIRQR